MNWNVNMRLVVDVLAKLQYGLPVRGLDAINIQSVTKEHINSLRTSEFSLLTVIAIHQEPAERNLLKRLTSRT